MLQDGSTDFMENNTLPPAKKRRNYTWIVAVMSILILMGLAYYAIFLHRGDIPDEPIDSFVTEEPTPEPTATPKPSLVPTSEPAGEAFETAAPQTYVKTSIIIDGVSAITLSSRQAAEELLRNVEYYYTTLDVIPAGANTELLNTVEFADAGENAETTDYDSAFRLLTGPGTPLTFRSTASFIQESIAAHSDETEYTDALPLGMRIVVRYGMDGLIRKTFGSTYLNGVRMEIIERERVTVYPAVNGKVLIGTSEYDEDKLPALGIGSAAPIPDGITLSAPLLGRAIKFYGMYPEGFHNGIDIGAAPGASVKAACGGTIVAVMERGSYGLMVDILHDGGIVTRYSRLGEVTVSLGSTVAKGDVIGTVADDYSSPHLHFEVRFRCASYDPLLCLSDISVFGDGLPIDQTA